MYVLIYLVEYIFLFQFSISILLTQSLSQNSLLYDVTTCYVNVHRSLLACVGENMLISTLVPLMMVLNKPEYRHLFKNETLNQNTHYQVRQKYDVYVDE